MFILFFFSTGVLAAIDLVDGHHRRLLQVGYTYIPVAADAPVNDQPFDISHLTGLIVFISCGAVFAFLYVIAWICGSNIPYYSLTKH